MTAGVELEGGTFAITGGLSLLGEHISRQLIDAGAERVVLVDNLVFHEHETHSHRASSDTRVELCRADVRDTSAVEEAFAGVTGVFHTAAFVTLPLSKRPAEGVDVNVRGTESVLRAASAAGVRKFVLSASVAMYGDAIDDPITEESPYRTHGLQPAARLYGASKIIAEAFSELYSITTGLSYVSLRYSSLYGESQRGRGLNAMHLWDAFEQMSRGDAPSLSASPTEAHDYLYAGDAARANLAAMASDVSSEAFTIATGTAVTLGDAVALLAELMRFDRPASFSDSADRTKFSTTEVLNYDISKASRHLRWGPQVSLREGLRAIVEKHLNTTRPKGAV